MHFFFSDSGAGQGLLRPDGLWSWERAFPGTPENVGAARRLVTSLLAGSPLRDDAVLAVSELFTNAIVHTESGEPGGQAVVHVGLWQAGTRIAVTDQGTPGVPVICRPAAPGLPSESGRGLLVVSGLARGLYWRGDRYGRTVCAVIGSLPAGHRVAQVPAHWSASWTPE